MRKPRRIQLPLTTAADITEHEHVFELSEMNTLLAEMPEAAELIFHDLVRPGTSVSRGRQGMTAEQVLRALLVKQLNQFTYAQLAFHLSDSVNYRAFCLIGPGEKAPKRSALQENIKRIKPKTLEAVNRMILGVVRARGIEVGTKVRTDCTVIESNIHEPSDSSLLWDGVRVLTRLMGQAQELGASIHFTDHTRRAKRRFLNIQYAKTRQQRAKLYQDLLRVTDRTVRYAEQAVERLQGMTFHDMMIAFKIDAIASELRRVARLAHCVVSQTERRVLRRESVPASEKVVSLFESHTDIIVKDNRETLYGHKVCFTAGGSGLVLDLLVQTGNPADSTLAVEMMRRHSNTYGQPPRQAAFDGGFASRANLEQIKELGVHDVVFSKGRGLKITEMAKSAWVYRRLRNFRAGVESVVSFLKRVLGWTRCTWSGFESFKAYAWASVLACNALLVARHARR